ncbi:transcription factor RelB [Pseudonaja textilis]|uniref:transcription factor RelB n=1 Tax=Pseudonaja textilis TaxID=8673 RepID=UPI000EA8C6D4|nr:transcription factor RelB [Pseudonaja textilis]
MQPNRETSDELAIIDELIKEDGFGEDGAPKLIPRSTNFAPSEMERAGRMSLLLEPYGVSDLPTPGSPQDSFPQQLSRTLNSLSLQPQLVPRGLPPLPLPSSRDLDALWPAPGPSGCSTVAPKPLDETMRDPPKLVIIEQPKQRGMRFRYQCEGRSAGSILGEGSSETNKTLPTIELQNFEGIPEVKVTACLVWKDWPYRIHPHSLVGKDCNNGLCEVTLKPRINARHRYIAPSPRQRVWGVEMMMMAWDDPRVGYKSDRVTKTALLLHLYFAEDISVIFRKDAWEGRADFSQADVHRQIAIVFKTPPYQHLDILEPVEVEVYLRRLTDSVSSEPFMFTYLPKDTDTYRVNKKRKQGMPDVLGELSGPDPHGIEAKRKKKKPDYMDHFNLTPSADFSLPSPDDRGFQASMERITLPDLFEEFGRFPSFSPYSGPSLSDVVLPSSTSYEERAEREFLLDAYSVHSGITIPLPLPGDCDPEGVATLVGSSMFPSQYKEDEEDLETENIADV